MKIIVLGSGTSFGIPMVGCNCLVCTSPDPKNKRLRASIYGTEGDLSFLVDCGPDFRLQALTYGIRQLDVVFITHQHFDHLAGIDDLRIFNFINKRPIEVHGNDAVIADIRHRYNYAFEPVQIGGGVPKLNLHVIKERTKIGEVTVTPIPIKHGKLDILAFRFNDFGYVTDCSYMPTESIELLRGIKVLIINGLRHQPHSTHFSIWQALETARQIGSEKTYFTHISHKLEHNETNSLLPAGYELAYDGLVIEI